jgi:hypothetical protein
MIGFRIFRLPVSYLKICIDYNRLKLKFFCVYETWALTPRKEHRIRVLDRWDRNVYKIFIRKPVSPCQQQVRTSNPYLVIITFCWRKKTTSAKKSKEITNVSVKTNRSPLWATSDVVRSTQQTITAWTSLSLRTQFLFCSTHIFKHEDDCLLECCAM